MKKISVVVSVYNEEAVLTQFREAIDKVVKNLKWDYEIIFVNDGSKDKSGEIISEFADDDKNIKVINFSRNFGHDAAMIAGVDYATGDGIICMDADLQHPVELISDIIEKFEEGYEVITMVRTKNKSAGFMKNITSGLFYKILNKLSSVEFDANASDFFAIAKKPADVLRKDYREKTRFLRGFVQDVGFKKTNIEYEAKDRAAGESKYSFKKLMNFAVNALLSFSDLPLKAATICGGIAGFTGLAIMIYTIVSKVANGTPAGYATIIVVLCFMFAILFILLGILGEYIGILFKEVKGRPIYIVGDTKNLESDTNKEELIGNESNKNE